MPFGENDYSYGIPESDLHIYIRWENENSNTLASATACYLGGVNGRPTFGRISWNINFMTRMTEEQLNEPQEVED